MIVCGIVVLALVAGILATGFAQELRRRTFLPTWNIVARDTFLSDSRSRQAVAAAGLSRLGEEGVDPFRAALAGDAGMAEPSIGICTTCSKPPQGGEAVGRGQRATPENQLARQRARIASKTGWICAR